MLVLGDDRSFSRAVSFKLPSNIEGEIRSDPDDDLLDGGIEMICRGLFLARRGADARRSRVEDILMTFYGKCTVFVKSNNCP